MLKNNNNNNNKKPKGKIETTAQAGDDVGKGSLIHCGWENKMVQPHPHHLPISLTGQLTQAVSRLSRLHQITAEV